MRRSIHLRTKCSSIAFGPSVHQESHVLGTTGGGRGYAISIQAAAGNTAVKKLSLKRAQQLLSQGHSYFPIEIEMGRHGRPPITNRKYQTKEEVLIRFVDFFLTENLDKVGKVNDLLISHTQHRRTRIQSGSFQDEFPLQSLQHIQAKPSKQVIGVFNHLLFETVRHIPLLLQVELKYLGSIRCLSRTPIPRPP